MSEKKDNKALSFMEDILAEELAEKALGFVKPVIKPAVKKLEDYLGEDERMIIIRKPKGKDGVVVIMETKDIVSFRTSNDDYISFSMKEFVELLISGKFK